MGDDVRIFQNPQIDGSAFHWQAGPVGVLLLHGFTATTAEVRPLAQRLLAEGCTVSAPLLPGHGTSPADLNTKKWRDWVNAAEQAYQSLAADCAPVFVGGLSMGGLLALYLASQHPQIAGILLYAPAYWAPRLRAARLLAAFRESVPKQPGSRPMLWKGYWVNPLAAAGQLWALRGQVAARIHQVRQPVIIFQGRLDQTVDPRGAQMVYNEVQSSHKELHWLENSTHVLLLDVEFEQVARQTVDFLKSRLQDSVIMRNTQPG